MKRSLPILLYHHVSPDREITPQVFESHMRYLLDQGMACVGMDSLVPILRGAQTLQKPGFVLTFDDGNDNNWSYAFPILQKLGIPATFYLVTERVGSSGFVTWDQVQAMASSGLATIGSHTHTHRHFVRKEAYENLEEELRTSKALIESHTGRPCRHLAWPWGDYETEWLPLAQKLGYETAATTLAGANAPGSDPYELRRINVRHPETEWLESRLKWNTYALPAGFFGMFYGWDRRFKVWRNAETPYSHG